MSEWQPIETAPKDGTDILVTGNGPTRVANWSTFGDTRGCFRVNAHSFVRLDPTHWMPLPEPPK